MGAHCVLSICISFVICTSVLQDFGPAHTFWCLGFKQMVCLGFVVLAIAPLKCKYVDNMQLATAAQSLDDGDFNAKVTRRDEGAIGLNILTHARMQMSMTLTYTHTHIYNCTQHQFWDHFALLGLIDAVLLHHETHTQPCTPTVHYTCVNGIARPQLRMWDMDYAEVAQEQDTGMQNDVLENSGICVTSLDTVRNEEMWGDWPSSVQHASGMWDCPNCHDSTHG